MKKEPIIYSGSGSAIDNYFAPKPVATQPTENWAKFDKKNARHMLILSLCRQAQWVTNTQRFGEVADLNRLSNFLKSEKSPVKKPLMKMNDDEIEKIITALSGVISHLYSKKKPCK